MEPDPILLDTQCPLDDIRNVIDKTAKYVARNGPEFEQCVRRTEDHTKVAFSYPTIPIGTTMSTR